MSPRKVNKEERRREVALSCSKLLHEVGMKNLTVAQVAKTAGIGKGTIYEYFENKEDIIFEIINIHIEEYHEEFLQSVQNIESTREKIFLFFNFVLSDSEENQKHFKGYQEYLSVLLAEENDAMFDFNNKCSLFFRNHLHAIIKEGIEKKELKEEALVFVDGLMVFEKGLVLMKMTNKDFDAKVSCERFINNFFDLIEIKQD